MNACVFSQKTLRCVEHGGNYTGSRRCADAWRGDRLDAKIRRLVAKRDRMRRA